jgi:hypothetical protein
MCWLLQWTVYIFVPVTVYIGYISHPLEAYWLYVSPPTFYPHVAFTCLVLFSEQTAVIFLCTFNITEMVCVYCAVLRYGRLTVWRLTTCIYVVRHS